MNINYVKDQLLIQESYNSSNLCLKLKIYNSVEVRGESLQDSLLKTQSNSVTTRIDSFSMISKEYETAEISEELVEIKEKLQAEKVFFHNNIKYVHIFQE